MSKKIIEGEIIEAEAFGDTHINIKLPLNEAKQLLQALEWKGCDSCEHQEQMHCTNTNSWLYDEHLSNKVTCIHHKKGNSK